MASPIIIIGPGPKVESSMSDEQTLEVLLDAVAELRGQMRRKAEISAIPAQAGE